MYTLYSMQRSGNSYKVRLALAQLRIPYRLVEVDILKGESRTPEFLAKNPNGQVPLLEVAPGRYLAESNAILWYIAGGTPLRPRTASIAPRRCNGCSSSSTASSPISAPPISGWRWSRAGANCSSTRSRTGWRKAIARCGVMENHLERHDFFAADRYTIADIALYAYTHLAHECDYDLSRFPAIRAWLARVAAEPGTSRWSGSRKRWKRRSRR